MKITPEQRARLEGRVKEILSFDKQVRTEDEFLLAMQALSHEEDVARRLLIALKGMLDALPSKEECFIPHRVRGPLRMARAAIVIAESR